MVYTALLSLSSHTANTVSIYDLLGKYSIMEIEKSTREQTLFNLDFIQSEEWRSLISEWLAHKAEIKQPHGMTVAKRAYKQLVRESGGDIELADRIVEYCTQAVSQKTGKPYMALYNPFKNKNEYGFNKESVSEHRMQQEFAETLARKMGSRNT